MYCGSADFKNLELFNGERDLRLKVHKEGDKYSVQVVRRSLVSIIDSG